MAKKVDPQAKAKRQKITAAALGVVLLAVLAFQLPRTLKMLHQSSASASPAETTTASTATGTTGATGALATAGAGTTSTPASTGDGVTDPAVVRAPQSGQLLAFSRFRSKDPFSQQIDLNCDGDSGSSGGCATGGTTASSGGGTGKAAKPSSTKPATPTPTPSGTTTVAVKPTAAEISVNGSTESVTVGAKFPASNPTFVLVSLTKGAAKIGIAGGSLEGSKQTVTLKKGVPLTLMNTADGTRYVLRLVSAG
jgi:hypothetical protein